MRRSLFVWAAVAASAVAFAPVPAPLESGVKGRIVWDAEEAPANEEVTSFRDKEFCTSKGKVFKNDLIVDPKTKGLKNAVFWLVDAKKPLGTIPTPKPLLGKVIDVDTPCCEFVPRHVVVLEGQKLRAKNSAKVAHNFRLEGGPDGPELNFLLLPDKERMIGEVKPRPSPMLPFGCAIHPWMRGYVMALPSPYYAVSDAQGRFEIKGVPAGEYRLVGWHERLGWVFRAPRREERSLPVTVREKRTTELDTLWRKAE